MDKILNIINQISNTSSRNEKETILEQSKDNQLFKDILYFVYNPYILTGISKKKISKKLIPPKENSTLSITEIMEYLKSHNTGKDENIILVQHFINSQPIELQELYTQIITKDLKIGVETKTINKVFGKGFVPEFNVMLAEKYFGNQDKVKGDFIITEKLDGNRSVIFNNDKIDMRTRQGQKYDGFIDIEEEIKLLPKGYVYDGEFIAINPEGLSSKDLYRKTTSIVRKDGIKKDVIFHVFDMIPINDFRNGICNTPCIQRKTELHNILKELNLKWIKEVEMLYVGSDKNEIIKLLDKVVAEEKEGVMVNLADASYSCKRTPDILKVKKMQSADLKIVGFEEGEGRLKGTLGRINVEYKNNIVGLGSGFSDEDRKYIWENQNDLINSIIEVQFFEESTNKKTKEVSLRFPVFKCLRDDKTEESYY